MTDQANHPTRRRALGISVLGILLAVVGGIVAYSAYGVQSNQASNEPSVYEYTINQSVGTSVRYFDSSFFANSQPSPNNNAFIADLTEDIKGTFGYTFKASAPTNLVTTYSVTAQVQSNYAVKGNSEESSNVWQKQYQLVAPTTRTVSDAIITLEPSVVIPYAEYRKVAMQFRESLTLPTTSQAVIAVDIKTSGTIEGTPFTDTRTSSITVPLEEQIYQPAIKFDKQDTKQVVPQTAVAGADRTAKFMLYGGGAISAGGLALTVFGLRRRIFKSGYQRELDKIYRYHDGIIVRTSRPIDLSDHNVVPMRSFDDMLNLEEELKSPIIADEISSTLTHFLIAHNNVMYLYKLGDSHDTTNHTIAARTTTQALVAAEHPRTTHSPHKPMRQPISVTQANDNWGDIIKELDKTPPKPPRPKKKLQ